MPKVAGTPYFLPILIKRGTYNAISKIVASRKAVNRETGKPLGSSKQEMVNHTGFTRRQVYSAVVWLQKKGLAYGHRKGGWFTIPLPKHGICWKHGFALNPRGDCPVRFCRKGGE
jgi:hypothetical protein